MERYNKRTWLNKDDSPSLGSVVAFDGEVKYSDATERTIFLAISDCSKTIKLIKNTENIEDFTEKLKLLKCEIELFINHLENKKMEQKIERVPANLCATTFEEAIDNKIVEMNKKGFRFIPPMTIVEAEGHGEYQKAKHAVMLFEKL